MLKSRRRDKAELNILKATDIKVFEAVSRYRTYVLRYFS